MKCYWLTLLLFVSTALIAQAQTSRADTAASYLDRGKAWAAKGELERAIADFDLAIASDPSLAGAWYNRGAPGISNKTSTARSLILTGRSNSTLALHEPMLIAPPSVTPEATWMARSATIPKLSNWNPASLKPGAIAALPDSTKATTTERSKIARRPSNSIHATPTITTLAARPAITREIWTAPSTITRKRSSSTLASPSPITTGARRDTPKEIWTRQSPITAAASSLLPTSRSITPNGDWLCYSKAKRPRRSGISISA